jgi:hypothetical protein
MSRSLPFGSPCGFIRIVRVPPRRCAPRLTASHQQSHEQNDEQHRERDNDHHDAVATASATNAVLIMRLLRGPPKAPS